MSEKQFAIAVRIAERGGNYRRYVTRIMGCMNQERINEVINRIFDAMEYPTGYER